MKKLATLIALALGGVSCLAVIGLGLMMLFNILRPLTAITDFSVQCVEDINCRLDMDRKDEIGILALSLNKLMSHLRKQLAFSEGVLHGITVPCSVFSPRRGRCPSGRC